MPERSLPPNPRVPSRLYRAWLILFGVDETGARLRSLSASLEDARDELRRVAGENVRLKALMRNIHELTG